MKHMLCTSRKKRKLLHQNRRDGTNHTGKNQCPQAPRAKGMAGSALRGKGGETRRGTLNPPDPVKNRRKTKRMRRRDKRAKTSPRSGNAIANNPLCKVKVLRLSESSGKRGKT